MFLLYMLIILYLIRCCRTVLCNSILIFVLTMAETETSDSLRAKGNEYYRKKDYENAIGYYTKSLNIEKTAAWYESGPWPHASSYSNRALCYIQLKHFGNAEADATAALQCDPLFVKAWLRRGISRLQKKWYQKAYYDLLRVWAIGRLM